MIIPIGHDRGEVWRWPMVTPLLMCVCLAVFWVQWDSITRDREEGIQTFDEVLEYLFDHPWVEPDPRLHLPDWLLYELAAVRAEAEAYGLTEGWEYDSQNKKLDRLTEQWLEVRDRSVAQRYGYRADSPGAWSVFSYQFVHAGWMHLIGNLLILYLVGAPIEDVWGRPLFLLFYLTGGVVAALLDGAMSGTPHLPLIGASGAVAAAMGAFLVRFARAKLHFAYWFFVIGGTFTAPAWLMLLLWLSREGAYAWFFSKVLGVSSGVAHWAHVGGFVFGVGFAAFVHVFEIEKRVLRKRIGAKVDLHEHETLQKAHDLVDRGEREEAWTLLEKTLNDDPTDYEAALALWYLAVDLGRTRRVAPRLVPILVRELTSGDPVAASDLAAEMLDREPCPTTDRRALVQLAEGMTRAGAGGAAEPAVRSAIQSREPLAPPDLLRLAKLAERMDPIQAASYAAEVLATHEGLAPYVSDELERLTAFGRPRTDSGEPRDAAAPVVEPAPTGSLEPAAAPVASPFEVLTPRLVEVLAGRLLVELSGRRLKLMMDKVAAVGAARIEPRGVLAWQLLDLVLEEEEGAAAAPRKIVRLSSTEIDSNCLAALSPVSAAAATSPSFSDLILWAVRTSEAPALLVDLEQSPVWLPTFATLESYERALAASLGRGARPTTTVEAGLAPG